MRALSRVVSRPFMIVMLTVTLVAAVMAIGSTSTARAEDDRERVVIPEDVYRPKGSDIPTMWKVAVGKVTFYSEQPDPGYSEGSYHVKRGDDPYSYKVVSCYSSATYRLKGGRIYRFSAEPYDSGASPELRRIFIPSSETDAIISRVANGSTLRVWGRAYSLSGVEEVRVAVLENGKTVRKFQAATGVVVWKTAFSRIKKKGRYRVVARVVSTDGGVEVVKRRLVVR